VKRATNILLNTTNRRQAAGAIQHLLNHNDNGWGMGISAQARECEAGRHRGSDHRSPSRSRSRFLTDVGAELQTVDGIVIRHVLKAFAMEDRPALGIHDSVLCRVSDAGFAEAMIRIHYHWILGFYPVIAKVY
jgi:hypothetical protein